MAWTGRGAGGDERDGEFTEVLDPCLRETPARKPLCR